MVWINLVLKHGCFRWRKINPGGKSLRYVRSASCQVDRHIKKAWTEEISRHTTSSLGKIWRLRVGPRKVLPVVKASQTKFAASGPFWRCSYWALVICDHRDHQNTRRWFRRKWRWTWNARREIFRRLSGPNRMHQIRVCWYEWGWSAQWCLIRWHNRPRTSRYSSSLIRYRDIFAIINSICDRGWGSSPSKFGC